MKLEDWQFVLIFGLMGLAMITIVASTTWIVSSNEAAAFNRLTTGARTVEELVEVGRRYRRKPTAFEFAIITGFVKSFVGKTEQVEAQQ